MAETDQESGNPDSDPSSLVGNSVDLARFIGSAPWRTMRFIGGETLSALRQAENRARLLALAVTRQVLYDLAERGCDAGKVSDEEFNEVDGMFMETACQLTPEERLRVETEAEAIGRQLHNN